MGTMDDKAATLFGIESEAIFDQVSIAIASPDIIRSWSHGEVKTPETINYRTFKPERDGLFCEKIFGPTKDWECSCGKYKRIKHKGVVCDRCGVEVTEAKVRREQMGHIDLAVPVSHVWFLKSAPSRVGNVLGLPSRILERVIYYEDYIVINPGPEIDLKKLCRDNERASTTTELKAKQLLTETEYRAAVEKWGDTIEIGIGAEAVKKLLAAEDLDFLAAWIRCRIKGGEMKQEGGKFLCRDREKTAKPKRKPSDQTVAKLAKRLRIVEGFRKSGCRPEWMILSVLPVIPPDLRPLVPLEGGRFATSDLNDLYRRVINRNNRLKSILQLKTPEVIVRNEKRMLQEAVDALFDNGRQGRPVLGAANRPLKSLSDNLRGKQGRFRQNLLGKRVDYSGRSVIVIGPELKLNQCGLPKEMALELFEPFIIHRLKELGYVHTIKGAKKMIERQTKEVWDVLDEVIREHPVMLNRAPTLHRLGIQSFDPILVEGKAIRIHPLVCTAFNADFDGDQMAVHVPLSNEAQLEARVLMYAPNNIFSPASGEPIATPTQDIAIGCFYLTREEKEQKGPMRIFADEDAAIFVLSQKGIGLHELIKVRRTEGMVETTVGRLIFNQIFPAGVGYVNKQVNKKALSDLVSRCYKLVGQEETVKILDKLKDLGFEYATWSGVSLGMSDLVIPKKKGEILDRAFKEVTKVTKQYQEGSITDRERYNKVVDTWHHASQELSQQVFEDLRLAGKVGLNPLFMMVESGARGSREQIQQLAGMRGLMAKPSGDIHEYPITANFREGLSVLQYFVSTHGARKGLADTALKTADAGYLTRRLVDVSQDMIITIPDCGTIKGRTVSELMGQDDVLIPLKDRITGRTALDNVKDPVSGAIVVKSGVEITPEIADKIEKLGFDTLRIRSVLTCEAPEGVCAACYGRNLAVHRPAALGDAVGIIAAQSIGEPGTQLTMRTFHIGGTASLFARQPEIRTKGNGIIRYDERLRVVPTGTDKKHFKVINEGGTIAIYDSEGAKARELERYKLEVGAILEVADGQKVEKKQLLATWDPYNISILTEQDGVVEYLEIVEGETMEIRVDKATRKRERAIKLAISHDKHPQIVIRKGQTKEALAYYSIPAQAIIEVNNGATVKAGDRLARMPRKFTKTKDITGGLPRVTELFEARRPKGAAEIAKIGGRVEFSDRVRGKLKLIVKDAKTGKFEEHLIPQGQHIIVRKGDEVKKGDQLTEGPIELQELLEVCGIEATQEYLVNQVQEVYRSQGVKINDKHVEIIVRQMTSNVQISDPGDTDFLYDETVDHGRFQSENERVKELGGGPARSRNVILGITKASVSTESFISAASFQETTRVLTDAAASGKVDHLKGFKENVIMGHLIPAGTGFPALRKVDYQALPEGDKAKDKE
jgi:DNA-directed RNA polymerase subunit beta'